VPSSRRVGPRVGTVCQLDRALSRAILVRASGSTRLARPRRSAVVHLRTRPSRFATSGGVCHRPRRRPSCDAQSTPAPTALADQYSISTSTSGFVPHRGNSRRGTTIIHRTDVRSDGVVAACFDPTHAHAGDHPTVASPVANRRLIAAIHWYQRAVDGRPSPCRFSPSCSSYAVEALQVHGTRRGLWLALRRLSRCRPFGPSGFDPVPEAAPRSKSLRKEM